MVDETCVIWLNSLKVAGPQSVNWNRLVTFYGPFVRTILSQRGIKADAIEDISEFTRLDFGAIDEEDGDNAGALMELEEYLRVCVMVIYQDMQHNEEDGA